MQKTLSSLFVGLSVLAFSNQIFAEFDIPEFRGSALATYQHWDWFSSATEPNFPDVADDNPNGSASLMEMTGGAFQTGTGNIYSFAVPTEFIVTVPDFGLGPQAKTSVVVQVRTQGTFVDPGSVTFNGIPADSFEILYEEILGGFGGILRDWKFVWSEVDGNVLTNFVEFKAEESSMSLDEVAIDTLAILSNTDPVLVGSHVLHGGYAGSGSGPWNGVDLATQLIVRSSESQTALPANFINSSRGINGLVLDFDTLGDLEQLDFEFTWSPQGTFDPQANSIPLWQSAASPSSISLHAGEGAGGSDRVRVEWPSQSIMNRYLRIAVSSGEERLAELFVGHLLGVSSASAVSNGMFTVSFGDVSPIRAVVGHDADAGSKTDIDKDGTVSFSDIAAMRASVGTQLPQLVVPGQ